MSGGETLRVIPPDEVDLLKKQRDLVLPSARIAAYDDFAKWLFTVVAIVGTLGAAFSNAAFEKLNGAGAAVFAAAIGATGVSLALAVILRCVDPAEANWQNLQDMLNKGRSALVVKRRLGWVAGIGFAVAMALAGVSPLVSRGQGKGATAAGGSLLYAYGKDGVHVTATFFETPQSVGEIKLSAIQPGVESLIAAQRVAADSQGVIRLDIGSAPMPTGSTGIRISINCDSRQTNMQQEFVLSLQPPNDKVVANGSTNPCFK